MRESRATAVGMMPLQDAAELTPRPRRVSGLRARFAQSSTPAFSKVSSSHGTSRITRKSLKLNDRVYTLLVTKPRGPFLA